MARDNGGNGGVVFLAFVLGAIAGAAVALLWAPASGDDTRRYLQERARESRQKAAELARHGREFVERQRDAVAAAVEAGREAYRQSRGGEST
jgi:gas vesicle protein